MKYKFWILLILVGGILMIIGSAIGSANFYVYLINLATSLVGPEFLPLVAAILKVLEYIAFYGGYSVLAGLLLILIKHNKIGHIIISVATSFGILGLIIYSITWGVGYFNISISPTWQTALDTIYNLFTFNSGTAFAGTAVALVGKFGLKRTEKAEKANFKEYKTAQKTTSKDSESKSCPKCGSKVPLKANFCNECGKNI